MNGQNPLMSLCWQMCTIEVDKSFNRQVHLSTSYDIKYGASVLLFFLAHCSMLWISICSKPQTLIMSALWIEPLQFMPAVHCVDITGSMKWMLMSVYSIPVEGVSIWICFSGCCHIISGQKVTSFKCIFWKPSIWPTALPSDWPTSRLRSLCCELQSKLPLNIWWQRWCNLSHPVLRIAWNVR